jgi:hypothetical protein
MQPKEVVNEFVHYGMVGLYRATRCLMIKLGRIGRGKSWLDGGNLLLSPKVFSANF